MSDEWNYERDERRALIRQVRQRLESLGRAGLVQIHARSNAKLSAPAKDVLQARASGADRDAGDVAAPSVEHRPGPVNAPGLPETTNSRRPASENLEPAPPDTKDKGQKTKAKPASVPISRSSLFGESGFESPPVPAGDRPTILAASAAEVAACRRCPHLASTRTQTVFGTGSPTARLMFIGEAPGADEDRTGQPFVGRAGQLLTDMITKGMGLRREDVYIANVLKCRPPDNRQPTPEEAANCSSYLDHQIGVIRPDFLCLLGKTAAVALLDLPPTTTMAPLRKRWHSLKGIKTLVTYHPSYLLRTPSAKKDAWDDLKILMNEMGIPVPRRK